MVVSTLNSKTRQTGGLEGSLVLVTGAGGHLGREIAAGLAKDGAVPVLNGRNRETLDALSDKLERDGFECVVKPADVGDSMAMAGILRELAEFAARKGLRFDGLVNNAFAGTSADASNDLGTLFGEAARINLGATAELTKQFAELGADHARSVVNVASIYGVVSPDPSLYPEDVPVNPIHYGATKAGLLQLTRTMAVMYATQNVRINAIVPGPFPKDSVRQDHPEFVRKLARRVPLGRLGEAPEIYPPVRFLLSTGSSYVTGASIPVDGGWTAI